MRINAGFVCLPGGWCMTYYKGQGTQLGKPLLRSAITSASGLRVLYFFAIEARKPSYSVLPMLFVGTSPHRLRVEATVALIFGSSRWMTEFARDAQQIPRQFFGGCNPARCPQRVLKARGVDNLIPGDLEFPMYSSDVEPSQPLIFDRGRRMTEQARHPANVRDDFAFGNADLLCRHEVIRSNTQGENSPSPTLATRHL